MPLWQKMIADGITILPMTDKRMTRFWITLEQAVDFVCDCFLHLSRVTAGLDSAIFAETEIQGQVKAAYESAAHLISLPYELHYLFQNALKIGKRVRAEFALGRGMPDLEHAVYQAGLNLFPAPSKAKILLWVLLR